MVFELGIGEDIWRRVVLDPILQDDAKAPIPKHVPSLAPCDGHLGWCRSRVAQRFALVATAGEIATRWGLTGWAEGEAMAASLRLFKEWLALRGGAGDMEEQEGIDHVRHRLQTGFESQFTPWDADPATYSRTINRLGFRRQQTDGAHFYIFPSSFRNDICRGRDAERILSAMSRRSMLQVSNNPKDRRLTIKQRLPGIGGSNVYHVTPAIFESAE
ncbi:hypothetical protein FNU76_06290 [Chitinimonas arctica]|uniref:DUF927 domain-containing protein n=1 Tax=Chitinimonas arctica TaxID=2594795 RepID=A0A516SCW8_9NEIS|nr:hypothetical protein [Chitinimonas arctica]QDQ25991.1 hypothetical protein FNU76_06290 [Chitinimonas arctica]